MLIRFVVENFRSLKTEQILSLVRSSGEEMPDNYFDSKALATPPLLKSAVLYGANASGKSNVIKALASMIYIIENSFNKGLKESIAVNPFLFDINYQKESTMYDISLVVDLINDEGIEVPTRVDYGFVADKDKIYEEWLSVYPKGRERNLFSREFNKETSEYNWTMSEHFKGERVSWRNQTRQDQLFLSTVAHLNSEQMLPIYNSLVNRMPIVNTDRISNEITKKICKSSEKTKSIIISLLRSADIEVDDIVFEKPNINPNSRNKWLDVIPQDIINDFEEEIIAKHETFFVYHDNTGKEQKINLTQESDGTQKLFEFSGLILAVLNKGDTLIIDELNKSLHPDLVRFLVKLFNSPINRKNAQLIFTTHETSVLRKELLRRDQIWFCEKDKDRATTLYPLTDFKPHKSREDIEEYYLHGRYGAKPILKEFNHFWDN